ncbi:MAG: hypothetical protein WD100_03545 [Tistlia sp.]|uniref:hypothetical protein n=1 Tax=Tistlia sp. TaxID=3057121 RepID=UPI0034A0D4FB
MSGLDLKWSGSEKKVARRAFDLAFDAAFAKLMAEFKSRADAVAEPADLWEMERYLRRQRRELEELFDFRYSQLPLVFARLIREEYLDERHLAGLSDAKLEIVRSYLSLPKG